MTQQLKIIDGDGHIFEDGDAIARHFPYSAAGARLRSGVFPLNSHIQYSLTRTPPGAFATNPEGRFQNPGARWLDRVHGSGRIRLCCPLSHRRPTHRPDRRPRLRRAARRALTTTGWPRLICGAIPVSKASPFVPMHDAEAALEELRHAYTELGHVRRPVPCYRSALEPWRKTLLAGIRGSGSLGLPDRRSRRWPLGSRYGHDECFHRRQCHRSSDVAGDRFGGDGVEQSVRPFLRACAWLTSKAVRSGFSWRSNVFLDLTRRERRSIRAASCCICRRDKPSPTTSAGWFKQAAWWWASRAGNQTWPTRSKWRESKRSCSPRTFPTR